MALSAGTRLGPYEVIAKIGEGGMGEVYSARDTRLNRDVALKVLPDAFARDAERLARFTREAQTLASLNHPNIAHIHGLEEADGLRALVMELVEGDDLSERIARGSIPFDDALPIARQIADALEAAHEGGIVHRDLKPANIKLRPDGVVKVLDFGLAKASDPTMASGGTATNTPTLTSPAMTQAGTILGTAAYMAPEQARGRAVDKRADIWAFGAVLFEVLSGRRAFQGDDVTDTIVAVVSKEPDWTALPAATPVRLRRLLTRCLKKDPKTRLRDIGEARVQIEELIGGVSDDTEVSSTPGAGTTPRPAASRALPWILAASMTAVAAVAIVLWAPWRGQSSDAAAALRLSPLSFEPGGQTGAVWSPDQKAVAFGARQRDTEPYQIYVRYLDSPVPVQITHLTVTATLVEWTSTGRIVFTSTQAPAGFWSVSPVGGEPEPLIGYGALRPAGQGAVSRDGTAAAMFGGEDGVYRVYVSSPIGAAWAPYEPAPFATKGFRNIPVLKFSPDGRQLLLNRNGGSGEEETWLLPYPSSPGGPPRRVHLNLPPFHGTPTLSWTPDNRHVVMSVVRLGAAAQLVVADTASGSVSPLSSGTIAQRLPAVSPDGTKLVYVETSTDYDVVSVDLATAAVTPLIATQRSEQMPAWALREPALVYATDRNGPPEIWLHRPGQPGRPVVKASDFPPDTTRSFMGPVLSPDATRVVYSRPEQDGPAGLWISAVAGGSPVRLVKAGAVASYSGSWSPNGNWFVYLSFLDSKYSLLKVKTTAQAEPEVLKADVTLSSLLLPVWSPADDWILYSSGGLKLVSPDGRIVRELSSRGAVGAAFSADGRIVYGVRQASEDRVELFSVSVESGAEQILGLLAREHLPAVTIGPAHRMTLAPGGKSVTYGTVRAASNLWLMDGLQTAIVR